MRSLMTVLAIATTVVLIANSAPCAEPQNSNADSNAAQATKDPNYRWHNGQWWYWMSKQKNWMVWANDQWLPYEQARSQGAVRSFSYQAQGTQDSAVDGEGIQRLFGTPLSTMPRNVSRNEQIIGSYGMRRASAKALGDY